MIGSGTMVGGDSERVNAQERKRETPYPRTETCLHCQHPYIAERPRRKYCSQVCATTALRNPNFHGTFYGYTGKKCRCEKCRNANAVYSRRHRQIVRERRDARRISAAHASQRSGESPV